MGKTIEGELFDALMLLSPAMRRGCPGAPGFRLGVGDICGMRRRVLAALLAHEDGARQRDIVEEVGGEPSRVSELVDELEDGGWVERTADPSDKRATLVALTREGRARAHELEVRWAEHLDTMFEGLTDEERGRLLWLLDKIEAERRRDGDGGARL